MDKEIELDVEIKAGPPDGEAQNGKLVGKEPGLFEAEKEDHFSAGAKMVRSLSSTGKLEKKVSKISSKKIKWKLKLDVDGTARGNPSGGHTVYLTYDTPRDEGEMEDGVTGSITRSRFCPETEKASSTWRSTCPVPPSP